LGALPVVAYVAWGLNTMSVKLITRTFGLACLGLLLFTYTASAQEDGANPETALNAEPFLVSTEDLVKVPEEFHRQEIPYETLHPPGTLIVDTPNRFLYFVLSGERAIRYGIGVGRDGFDWAGTARIGRKAPWPNWYPPKAMVARDPFAAKWARGMPGGPKNPLGARALYLYANGADTLYRIHGTNQPASIGHAVSSGCVRMLNVDIIDLYDRVDAGSKVVVIAAPRETTIVARSQPPRQKVEKSVRKKPGTSFASIERFSLRHLRSSSGGVTKRAARKSSIVRKTNFNLSKSKLVSR
jgi:lipoprotein-anchoring transpeptidase ErfK/SrfK